MTIAYRYFGKFNRLTPSAMPFDSRQHIDRQRLNLTIDGAREKHSN